MKNELRKYFKELRQSLDSESVATMSNSAQELFLSSELYAMSENIMLYIPLGKETDTKKIIAQCFADGKTVLLPVTDKNTDTLTASVYTPDAELNSGAYSIMEPREIIPFDKNKIDLVIVPGIAFSLRGARIGFGKGCYDKFLDGIPAKKIGYCYELQLSGRIKPSEYDVEMDYIITNSRITDCAKQKKLMRANYHTHTYLSHHATDTPREYVETAIHNGLEILGFSDHNPCPFTNGYSTYYKVDVENIEKYVNMIKELRDEYKYKIEILIGYETEYYPKEFDTTMALLKSYDCDYMIMGQHYTNNDYDGVDTGTYTEDKDVLTLYIDQVIEGFKTGVFTYLAHPDLINYRGDDEFYKKEMKRLLQELKKLSIPVEFNLLGFEENRWYPYDEFWKLVKEAGNDVVLGCDAHRKGACGAPDIYLAGRAELDKYGITPIDYVTIKKVK